ncbi:hypothetical protein CHU94_18900 [Rhodoferax sp. TH121]|uniref:YgaP family membrane protein n=1 Tax=Rhodoferax sp. TH121 TaxID=2022803 RepID=UPI000B962D51|nr:DUF2892 domain-containing protein [Rhodoferax sp. TH121]OYQ39435.1 hypothetical protein CHU94_18900 [Rhodoferax sp. TH121]
MANTHPIDRFLRALAGVCLLVLGFFWLSGAWQWAAYAASVVMLATAALNFCPLYRLLGISTRTAPSVPASPIRTGVAWVLLLVTLVGGSYASAFASRKVFLEDFNVMNGFYKQTLFLTGKHEREKANAQYAQLVPALEGFVSKYTRYQPFALRGDSQWLADLDRVRRMVGDVAELVKTGDLQAAHLALEQVRPVFQDVFKRNGFSLLAVALVDFHDAMELILIAAQAKDMAKLAALYPGVSDKLAAVEAEAQDADIQAIRRNLDAVDAATRSQQADALPSLGEKLKSSFVKVYLQRG